MRFIRMLPIALPVLLSAFSVQAQDRLTGTWQPWGNGGGTASGTSWVPSGTGSEGGAWQCVPGGVNPNAPYAIAATFSRLSQSGGTVYVRLRWYSDSTCQTFLDRESGASAQDWGPNPAPPITLNTIVSAPSTAKGAAYIVSVLGRPGIGECSYAFSGLSMTGSPFLLTTITAIGPTTLCSPDQVHLRASASGGTGVYTAYQWYRNGLPLDQSATQDFYVSDSGTYAAAAIDSSGYTGVLSNAVSTIIVPTPDPPGATNNGPLCSGETLQLTAVPSIPGAAYAWVGPNGFTSTSQNPFIPHATAAASGNYFVTVVSAHLKTRESGQEPTRRGPETAMVQA